MDKNQVLTFLKKYGKKLGRQTSAPPQHTGDSMSRFIALLCLLAFAILGAVKFYQGILFTQECGGYLKRAADASSVEVAVTELGTAIAYMEKQGLTEGYTSVIYKTPDEDVGFWYTNLKQAHADLALLPEDSAKLEQSNMLMKLDGTVMERGKIGDQITAPAGIAIFPHNVGMAWAMGIFFVLFFILIPTPNRSDFRFRF